MVRCRRLGATALVVAALVSCSDDGESDSTLGPLDASDVTTAPVSASDVTSAPASGPTTAAGPTGSGFVSIAVRLGASGVDEALSLDRATVAAEQLDPLSLDAFCTALDGGEGLTVSVTDLRRLSAGNRLVSAVLRVNADVAGPGPYPGALEVGDAEQTVTRYEGQVAVAEDLSSGTFELRDAAGTAATGSFVCAPEPVVTTTSPATLVPASAVGDDGTQPTAPPLPTVPAATS